MIALRVVPFRTNTKTPAIFLSIVGFVSLEARCQTTPLSQPFRCHKST